MSKSNGRKKTSKAMTKSPNIGCFVSSASAAYQYYASNEGARKKAVARFETRVSQSPTKPTSAAPKSRRSA